MSVIPKFPFNDTAIIVNRGGADLYGQQKEESSLEVQCSIISTLTTPILTSTGQDVSATRGRAGDETSVTEMLVPLKTKVAKDDTVVFSPAIRGQGIVAAVAEVLIKKSVRGKPAFLILRLFHGIDEGASTSTETGSSGSGEAPTGAPSGW